MITKCQYNNALTVVDAYNRQMQNNDIPKWICTRTCTLNNSTFFIQGRVYLQELCKPFTLIDEDCELHEIGYWEANFVEIL